MAKLKILKIDTGVDRQTMGGIARFLTHSSKAGLRGLKMSKRRR